MNGCGGTCVPCVPCPANSHRKPNRTCYDTFDDCECKDGYFKRDRRCERCFMIQCSPGWVLEGDTNGCGGKCVPCAPILCSLGSQLVGDINGCGGTCVPCAPVLCSPGSQLVGDIN